MLKLIKFFGGALLIVATFAQPVVAGREFADIYTECGLGAMIAPRNGAVAAVTNVTWDSGTTAISSNISSPDTCVGGKEKMAAFIFDTQDLLLNELASGSGSYLDALAVIAGVEPARQQLFVTTLRLNLSGVVVTSDFIEKTRFEKAETLYNIVLQSIDENS